MREKRMLYQIKSLEKLIFRCFIDDIEKIEEIPSCPTPTQMQIIEYVVDHDGEVIFQKDLEKVLNLRRATVSGVLQTMEKNGLIERVCDSVDARVKRIILNEKAKEMFFRNVEKIEELEDIIVKGISSDKLKDFSLVLDMMKENLKNNVINPKTKDEGRKK